MVKTLEKEKISTVIKQNKDGYIYGVTFIDHHTKCVFNGSDLGKQYSAASLLERCGEAQRPVQRFSENQSKDIDRNLNSQNSHKHNHGIDEYPNNAPNILTELISPEQTNNYIPFQLKKVKRKRQSHRKI